MSATKIFKKFMTKLKDYENGPENFPYNPNLAEQVDAAIAELKAENARLKEDLYKTDHHNIQYLCRMCGCDNVEAFHGENKNLRMNIIATERALWMARAAFCGRSVEYLSGIQSHCLIGQEELYKKCEQIKQKYLKAFHKLIEKYKEYK